MPEARFAPRSLRQPVLWTGKIKDTTSEVVSVTDIIVVRDDYNVSGAHRQIACAIDFIPAPPQHVGGVSTPSFLFLSLRA